MRLSKEVAYLSGDTVRVTVVDADRNTHVSLRDTLTTALKVDALYTAGNDLVLDLQEDGVNSGTFLATIKTGTATAGGAGTSIRSNIGTLKTVQGGTATVAYTGVTPGAPTASRPLSFSSSDATLAFDADAYTIGSYAVITHTDAEENEDAEKVDKLPDHAYIKTSSRNYAKVKLVETGVDTGTFKGSIQVSSRATLDYERIQAGIGEELTVWCEDGINTTGALRTVKDKSRVVDVVPTPTPTPSPGVCIVEVIEPSPSTLSLKIGTGSDVTVTLTGEDGCLVAGETVEVSIRLGEGLISVSPDSQETDENGQAVFKVKAENKKGNAMIMFKAGDKMKTMTVRVQK